VSAREVAAGVRILRGRPPNGNSYLLGDVLVDSATRPGSKRLLESLRGERVSAHALSHVHPPTQGSSAAVCEAFGVGAWCGTGDAHVLESGNILQAQPDRLFNRFQQRFFAGPGVPVARRLREGDEVADFEVIEVPGHSPGHIAFWRSDDGVLMLGDVVTNENVWLGIPGLHEPPKVFTPDPARNRESARRLAALEPRLILFAHGPPLADGERFQSFVAKLP
jgi:glyoxylase-like metal-dependent hydrolase (beta-lactamase superfamily II)